MIISAIAANTIVITHLHHKFYFTIFWILPAFTDIFHLSFLAAFLVNAN